MATVFIPTPMRKFTQNKSRISLAAGTVAALFAELEQSCPGVSAQIYDAEGAIKRYINVFVNGKDIRNLAGVQTPVEDRDDVYIVPAMAGG
ncbi:MAG TPA: MoaD/ThiS family protein [Gallionella sp.]|nr:MoaD/ThiS family protein [Gallionella sp.]